MKVGVFNSPGTLHCFSCMFAKQRRYLMAADARQRLIEMLNPALRCSNLYRL
jgi:hypothetical protein